MDDRFLSYFERELSFLRGMGREFARKYPEVAGRLLLEPDRCEDPHVERLLEGCAFLSARIHQKIEDDFPEISQTLLNILYPHYTNPVPSMTVVQFAPLMQNLPKAGYLIPRGTEIFSNPVDGEPCRFRTGYEITLLPLEVTAAALTEPKTLVPGARQTLQIRLKLHSGMTFSEFPQDILRFYLDGPRQDVFHLYELLCNNVCDVECVSVGSGNPARASLGRGSVRPVGLGGDELLLSSGNERFGGFRLLQEYFAFPEKFLFLEVGGLSSLRGGRFGTAIDLLIYLDRRAEDSWQVGPETFRLNTAPAVNLFGKIAEPIRIDRRKSEYRVVPDRRRADATEVIGIESVAVAVRGAAGEAKEYKPLYSLEHHAPAEETTCWYAQRRHSGRFGDKGTDVYLSFCDHGARAVAPAAETVSVRITCSNRDLPARIAMGDPAGDFQMETAAPVAAIRCLLRPTETLRPALAGPLQWRLISHLALNHLSLVEGGEKALKEILALYDFHNSPATRQQINGIVRITSRQVTRRIGRGFCRGVEITIDFDEDRFVGCGLFLFASVLERFLGQYVSLNSFVQVVARSVQHNEVIKKWPPRNGERVLL